MKNLTIRLFNHKSESFDKIAAYITYTVRSHELSKLIDKCKKYTSAIEALHTGTDSIDPWTADEKTMRLAGITTKDEIEEFSTAQSEYKDLNDAIKNTGVTADEFAELSDTDKNFIRLYAHQDYKEIKLVGDMPEKIGKAVDQWYTKNNMKGVKEVVKSAIYDIIGKESDLFYGVGFKTSDIKEQDIKNFLAHFGGTAARRTVTTVDKKTGEKRKVLTNYDWINKSGNKTVTCTAMTDIIAVLLESRRDSLIVKRPEAVETPGVTDSETKTA